MGRRMDAVKGWAAALCAVAIGCTLLQMLAPKDEMCIRDSNSAVFGFIFVKILLQYIFDEIIE